MSDIHEISKGIVSDEILKNSPSEAKCIHELGLALRKFRREHQIDKKIIAIESYIEDLVIKLLENPDSDEKILEALEEAKNIVNALGETITQKKEKKIEFYANITALGKILERVGLQWSLLVMPFIINKIPPNFWQ